MNLKNQQMKRVIRIYTLLKLKYNPKRKPYLFPKNKIEEQI